MKKPTFSEKIRYAFENTLSAGTPALIGWLAILSLIIVIFGTFFIYVVGINPAESEPMNFVEAVWQSLMRSMDAGTLAGDFGWPFRLVMFLVTIGGIFIVSALIGVITSGLDQTIEELRKGRSKVIEDNHTLILGWSSKIFTIISEIVIANENQKKPRIVVMADVDKIEMEDEIKSKVPDRKNTRIICRTGCPIDIDDLKVVNPNGARSIIVLSPEQDEPDTYVIKSVLAITNNPGRKKDKFHIVAEIRNEENLEAATLVGDDEAVYVHSSDLIARVTAQTCRQSGLSVVYTELFDFGGDEIYYKNEPSLAGKSYKETLSAYNNSAVIGFMNEKGEVLINPPMNTVIGKADEMIVISEDDDTIIITPQIDKKVKEEIIVNNAENPAKKEKTLVLGWNVKGKTIITELENYVGEGSEVFVMSEKPETEAEIIEVKDMLTKQKLNYRIASTTTKKSLDEINIPEYDYIIILCYPDMDIQEADAKTLITLLHLRNYVKMADKHINIISEMLDIKNRDLAEVTKADDFIVSDKLTSLMISQLAENKNLKKVFDNLFSAEGSEIYLKPISNYIRLGEKVNFYTLIEAATRKNETAIGYRILAKAFDETAQYGVVVNPDKSIDVTFAEGDKLIVFAEE